jgi:outer membrane immunogenic protein
LRPFISIHCGFEETATGKWNRYSFLPLGLGERAMKKTLIGIAAIIASIGTSAFAADMAVKAPPPPAPVWSWTGFYLGVHAGGGWSKGDLRADYLPFPAFNVFPTLASSRASGALGGFQGGYNWQFANTWVAGLEGDYSWTKMNSTLTVIPNQIAPPVPIPVQPTTWTRNLDWLASARVRLGYTPMSNLLLYVTGGGAWGGFNYNGSFVNTAPGSNNWTAPFSKTESGYAVGGGAEWMVAAHWLLRAEYLYYRLSGTSNLANNPVFPTFPILFTWNSTNTNVVRVGASYKF